MNKFTNPLDRIKIASPCGVDWREMRGDDRRRYCAMCKLNVYNLSGMTRTEAESFLINSEGRVCVKFYRRADGSVLTNDCPVGWEKIKRRVSRTATAVFALVGGFFGGNFIFNQMTFDNHDFDNSDLMKKVPVVTDVRQESEPRSKGIEPVKKTNTVKRQLPVVGMVENIRDLRDEPVVAWIE